ncbi:MAG: glutamate-5-semialdehyde dehydrogenase [Candidatus Omnitrophica bacterium]|nr:glutamate-5-semialdehyde dehydrogenase [Candidatus Omnitrophota bacterium]
MGWKEIILGKAEKTKEAALNALNYTSSQKDAFLSALSANVAGNKDKIIKANKKDVSGAAKGGCSSAFIDRLTLNNGRIDRMLKSIDVVKSLPDPVGKKIWETTRPNGLRIEKVRTPIGVIGIIYESRPDVTVEAGILCLKSGNGVILRGGKEAKQTNRALAGIMRDSLREAGLSEDMLNLVSEGGRMSVKYLLSLHRSIDLIIPRGGESLIRMVAENSLIPVIKHYKGVCHTYVDRDADLNMALKVAFNAKVQRPATCNAMETLLVHKDIAHKFLPEMAEMFRKAGVEMRGCGKTMEILRGIKKASEEDWSSEYLDLIVSIRIVDSAESAVEHINRYGTMHSEAVITENKETAAGFFKEVDAAALFHNASTRFTDGGEFGLGAEIGISTDKIHARGPMGLEELTTYKYLIHGNGQIRQ